MRNQQNVKVRVNSSFETICPFPVGYVYMSSNSTSPADIYGGTWSAISGGRYMRAASAWGNGGSNTITINQLPAHNHGMNRFYLYDKGGWSAPINGNAVPQVASNVTTTPFATPISRDSSVNTGGGQHSTQPTKTFGRGTELPKEGDASCVTFNKFKSALQAVSRRFVHSPLVISICQLMVQAQQALTVVHGHLLQIVGSCGQAVRGIQQVAKVRILLLHKKCHHTLMVFGILLANRTLSKELSLTSQVGLNRVGAERIWMLLVATLHTTTSRLIAPATAGIARLKTKRELGFNSSNSLFFYWAKAIKSLLSFFIVI